MAQEGRARVVFVSYAHEDDDLRVRLEVVLKPLVRSKTLEIWADDRIGVSRVWNDEIEESLKRAEVAVLLISADFLASDYIMDVELPRLIERGVPLVCVPVGPCGWKETESLARVQWALPPERYLSAMKREERDGAFMVVYEALAKIAAQLAGPDAGPAVAPPARPARDLVAGAPGLSVGVPPLPDGYQPRPGDLDTLKQRLRLSAEVGLVGRRATMGLHGQGGVGKSVLAAAVCHEDDVRSWFPDGVFWVTLGETPDLVAAQRDLARRLGEKEPSFSDPIEGLRVLRRLLADRRCLVVVDDVWSTAAAEAFSATSSAGRVLLTTRDASILAAMGATAQPVDVLDQAASLAFLEQALGPVAADDRPAVEAAIAQTGGVILALSLVAATVRAGATWAEVTSRLEALAQVYGEHPYADVFKPMRIAVDRLSRLDADRYYRLGVFPEDVAVPHATAGRLWGVDDPGPTLARLADAHLLTSEAEGVRFHDLQRAFLIFAADEPWALLHRHLLDRHRPEQGWAYLPDDEPYLWDHLLYHLQMAGEHHEMAAVVTNGRWLARRLHRDGVYPTEVDLTRVAAARPQEAKVGEVLALVRRWSALFRSDLTLSDVAATLISRLPSAEPQVSDLLGAVWLKPAWPLPDAPQALLRTLTGHTGPVSAVAFAPDGRTLATASYDRTVRLWDPAIGTEVRTLTGHTDTVSAVAFAPDGHTLATASWDDTVRLWDPAIGTEVRTLTGHTGTVTAVAFAPDGHTLATASYDRTVRLWDPAIGAEVRTLTGHTGTVTAVAFAPDGHTLATASRDDTVRLWDPATGAEVRTLTGHQDVVVAVAFAPDGHTLATASWDGTVRLWDPATGAEVRTLTGHIGTVNAVAFAPDGDTLATASWDGTVRLWDPATGAEVRTLTGHTRMVTAVAFAPDGDTLATGSRDGTVRLWDPATGAEVRTPTGHTRMVTAVAFAPDGDTLATASYDRTVRLWDPVTGAEVRTLTGHTGTVTAVAFVPDGNTLATAGDTLSNASWDWNVIVRLWDPATGTEVRTITGHTDTVTAVAFAPDGHTLATASRDRTVRLWDPATGNEIRTLTGHTSPVTAVALAPDGRTLATASYDRTVRLWDPATGTEVRTLTGHQDVVIAVAFAPDGHTLATASRDHTVRLWDPATGAQLTAVSLGAPVASCAWSPRDPSLAASFGTNVTVLTIERH